jgi:hypothetical protein
MNAEKLSTLVGGMVGLFPAEITELLTKNGVVVDTINLNIDNLVTATFYALDKSVSFRKDFIDLYFANEELINSKIETTGYSNAEGGGFDYGGLATSLIGGVGGFFNSKNNLKASQVQADAMLQSGQLSLEAQKLALEGEKLKSQTAIALAQAKPQGNTTLYVALGIGGVLVLGLVIWAVTRKKA